MNALRWVAREQGEDLLALGMADRPYSPYEALGQKTPSYDLNQPGAVAEIKAALIAAAERDRNPFDNPDPIQETRWRQIITEGKYAESWDGATADEFVMAMSRYAPDSGLTGPFIQIGGSRFGSGIVGGPQPTPQGLEVLAGQGKHLMPMYMAWRGGTLDPPSSVSGPDADAIVVPSSKHGPIWMETGYTVVADDGVPKYVTAAKQIDDSLISCWTQLGQAQSEQARALLMRDCVLPQRRAHHLAALEANKDQPDPPCPGQLVYDRRTGECVEGGNVTLPEIDIETTREKVREQCIADSIADGMSRREAERICPYGPATDVPWRSVAVAAALGGAVGLGLWYLTKKGTRP